MGKMKSFKEFSQDKELSEQYTSEALSIAQRLKKSRLFKRIAAKIKLGKKRACLLYTSPSPRDQRGSRIPWFW